MSSYFNKLQMDFIHKEKWSSKPGTLDLSNEPLGFTLQQGSLKEKLWSTPFSALPWTWAWKCSLALPEGRVEQHQENFSDDFMAKMFPQLTLAVSLVTVAANDLVKAVPAATVTQQT